MSAGLHCLLRQLIRQTVSARRIDNTRGSWPIEQGATELGANKQGAVERGPFGGRAILGAFAALPLASPVLLRPMEGGPHDLAMVRRHRLPFLCVGANR